MKDTKKAARALQALTTAALALPGLAAAEVQTEYLFAHYKEADLPASKGGGVGSERYEINSHRFRIVAPVDEVVGTLNLTYETLSGASPWFVMPGIDGRPVQIMSGASIREERLDIEPSVTFKLDQMQVSTSVGYSTEDDYESFSGGVELEYTPPAAAYSYVGGIGYSYDRLEPTDARGGPYDYRIDKADKDSLTAYAGVSFIINAQTVIQGSIGYGRNNGYLSDPYKLAWIEGLSDTVSDWRPGGRQSYTLNARLRHYVSRFGAALHADYRLYDDNWKITAHTVDVAWHQNLGDSWRLTPSIRWYSQSQAYFYAPFYGSVRSDGYASSDYRLSPYGAISARLDVRKSIAKWELGLGAEYYEASADYALKNVGTENPGLVEFMSLTAKLVYQFQ